MGFKGNVLLGFEVISPPPLAPARSMARCTKNDGELDSDVELQSSGAFRPLEGAGLSPPSQSRLCCAHAQSRQVPCSGRRTAMGAGLARNPGVEICWLCSTGLEISSEQDS